MTETIQRVDPDFYEADDDGYMQASEEAGKDDHAKGVTFALYVQFPWQQMVHYVSDDHEGLFTFTEQERAAFPTWVEKTYKGVDWTIHGMGVEDEDAQLEASVYGEYQEGEDDAALGYRMCVLNAAYTRVRNEWTIYYSGMHRYIEWCREQREN